MEFFTGLQASLLLLRSTPLRQLNDRETIPKARTKEIVDINALHAVLQKLHKEVNNNSKTECTQGQRQHKAKKTYRSSILHSEILWWWESTQSTSTSYKFSGRNQSWRRKPIPTWYSSRKICWTLCRKLSTLNAYYCISLHKNHWRYPENWDSKRSTMTSIIVS